MITLHAFKPEHLANLRLQKAQEYVSSNLLDPEYAQMLAQHTAYTALDAAGAVVGCAGLMQVWQGRAIAWVLLGANAGQHMRPITRAVDGMLKACPFRRVEAWVDQEFEAGLRWIRLLGFEQETPQPMRGFRPDGGPSYLFARIKDAQ